MLAYFQYCIKGRDQSSKLWLQDFLLDCANELSEQSSLLCSDGITPPSPETRCSFLTLSEYTIRTQRYQRTDSPGDEVHS
jgi:hypothetical protein